MIIHDYYLSRLSVTDRGTKDKEKEYKKWLEKEFIIPLANTKKEIMDKLRKESDETIFYPQPEDLQNLPPDSALLKISFVLKKPYTSKDEAEFRILNNNIIENPIARDKFTGKPYIKPTTWKNLRFKVK